MALVPHLHPVVDLVALQLLRLLPHLLYVARNEVVSVVTIGEFCVVPRILGHLELILELVALQGRLCNLFNFLLNSLASDILLEEQVTQVIHLQIVDLLHTDSLLD